MSMDSKNNKNIDRRSFLKRAGAGAAVISAAALAGCESKRNPVSGESLTPLPDLEKGKMTYRTNPTTGDKVSILGYGCMRWPTLPTEGDPLDQETINRLVDKAIEYGVNYFDTSPAYCKGHSEEATGIALKRHPRDKYFVATKLSNFSPSTWSREASMRMYHDSFRNLQVDYIDYLLLHGVGMGDDGMETLAIHRQRYARLPARRAREGAHTQPRILISR